MVGAGYFKLVTNEARYKRRQEKQKVMYWQELKSLTWSLCFQPNVVAGV